MTSKCITLATRGANYKWVSSLHSLTHPLPANQKVSPVEDREVENGNYRLSLHWGQTGLLNLISSLTTDWNIVLAPAPIFQIRKLRHGVAKWLAQSHTVTWQGKAVSPPALSTQSWKNTSHLLCAILGLAAHSWHLLKLGHKTGLGS